MGSKDGASCGRYLSVASGVISVPQPGSKCIKQQSAELCQMASVDGSCGQDVGNLHVTRQRIGGTLGSNRGTREGL